MLVFLAIVPRFRAFNTGYLHRGTSVGVGAGRITLIFFYPAFGNEIIGYLITSTSTRITTAPTLPFFAIPGIQRGRRSWGGNFKVH